MHAPQCASRESRGIREMERLDHSFVIEDVRYDYPELLKWLRDYGETTSPRGMKTHEMLDVVIKLDPHRAIVNGINRKLSFKLISMEALQLISCSSYPQRTVKAAPGMGRYMNGGVFHGAYGVRMGMQLEAAINRLKSDKDSRQALITIWDPVLDAFRETQPKDVPCTTILQFLIRNDQLVLHVTMRSNDCWWGTPHDWGQFSQLQLAMANVLDVEAGPYYHHAVSFHLYEKDFEKIDALHPPNGTHMIFMGIGWPKMPFDVMQDRAEMLISTTQSVSPANSTEAWHRLQQFHIDDGEHHED
jgi:thymidylate synthase